MPALSRLNKTILFALCFLRVALAQEPQTIEPVKTQITVTGNVATESPASLTVFGSQRLLQIPGVNLDDRLRMIPGFTLLRRTSSIAANPTTQGVSLRGIGSSGTSRTLVLWDAIPLNDPFGGWVYWTRVPPEGIERSELSRGATTSVFGDRAMGGTIHLLTPTPSQEHVMLQFEGGNKTTLMPYGSYSNLFRGRWGVTAGMRALTTDGYYIVPDSIRGSIDTPAGVKFLAPNMKIDWLGSKDRFSFKTDVLAEERANGTAAVGNSTSIGSLSGNYTRSGSQGGLSLLSFYQTQEYRATFSAIAADRNSERVTSRQSVPAEAVGGAGYGTWRGQGINVVGGGDFLRVSGTSRDWLVPTGERIAGGEIFQRGVFGQADFTWKDFKLFLGSRYQWTGLQDGSHFYSPSGGFTWGRHWLRLRGSAYRSFRAPTLNELYREFRAGNTVTQANPSLRPEVLAGAEVGADIVLERMRLSVTTFRNDLTDLISNVTLSSTPALVTRQRQNVAAALSRGAEVDFRYRWSRWFFDASYLFADSRFSTRERIPQVARHQGTAQLSWSRNGTMITGGMRATDLQFEDDRNTQLLPGFVVFHIVGQQSLSHGVSLYATMENVSNREFLSGWTPAAQIGAPRLWRVGVRWQGRFRP